MERPVNDILSSGEPDFPFMLCWANENWARNWDGGFTDVLMYQEYSDEDDAEHIRWLCQNVFQDKRYIRISGRPVFAVYRVSLFPDFKNTIAIWRKVAKEEYGMELYLIETMFPGDSAHTSLTEGVDAAMDFQPIGVMATGLTQVKTIPLDKKESHGSRPTVYNYADYVDYCCGIDLPDRCFPCVSPGFDNSPRRVGRTFLSFTEQSPTNYGRWLFDALCRETSFTEEDENLVFVNAWNEWAEGNHLEPDQKWGRAYLEETKRIIAEYTAKGKPLDYDSLIQKRFEELKIHDVIETKLVYDNCKRSIKNKSVSFRHSYKLINNCRKKMSKMEYVKLFAKLIYYKIR